MSAADDRRETCIRREARAVALARQATASVLESLTRTRPLRLDHRTLDGIMGAIGVAIDTGMREAAEAAAAESGDLSLALEEGGEHLRVLHIFPARAATDGSAGWYAEVCRGGQNPKRWYYSDATMLANVLQDLLKEISA